MDNFLVGCFEYNISKSFENVYIRGFLKRKTWIFHVFRTKNKTIDGFLKELDPSVDLGEDVNGMLEAFVHEGEYEFGDDKGIKNNLSLQSYYLIRYNLY